MSQSRGETDEFMAALCSGIAPASRLIVCGFAGDPNLVGPSAWKPRPYAAGRDLMHDCGVMPSWNAYVTVASFNRAADHSYRRRGECFAAGHALMIDDIGTKVDAGVCQHVTPSIMIETSPGNQQWWYLLDKPETDAGRFDGVIRSFISGKLLGADPGMSGVTRVGRIPGYVNDKAKYGGNFPVSLKLLSDRRYSIEDLLAAFDLKINGTRTIREKLQSEEAIERNRMFMVYYKWLKERGMLKRNEPDPSGWIEATCPFIENHTDGADTGFAIREPDADNFFWGAAKCHHGHCIDKTWHDVTDWINEMSAEELEEAAK